MRAKYAILGAFLAVAIITALCWYSFSRGRLAAFNDLLQDKCRHVKPENTIMCYYPGLE